jgi:hypothetical protein
MWSNITSLDRTELHVKELDVTFMYRKTFPLLCVVTRV